VQQRWRKDAPWLGILDSLDDTGTVVDVLLSTLVVPQLVSSAELDVANVTEELVGSQGFLSTSLAVKSSPFRPTR